MLIRDNSVVNGNINNSGIIRAYGIGNGLHIDNTSSINGDIINSGVIRGGSHGLAFRDLANVAGNITNSGTIIGDANDGINFVDMAEVTSNVTNSGIIRGNNNGISVDSFSTINGLTNQAGANILGGVYGIYINDSSSVNNSIENYATITGTGNVDSIYISADSNVSDIDTYDGSVINGDIDAVNTNLNINGGEINGTMNVNSVNINSGAVFTMNHNITAQNAVTNAGTLVINNTSQTITGNYNQSTGGILKVDVRDTTNYGQLDASGAVDLSQSGTIDVNVVNAANIEIGDVFSNVISANILVAPTNGFNVSDNSRLLNFTGILNNSNNGVNLVAIDDASTSVAQSNSAMGNRGGAGAASKLDEIITLNPNGDWQNVIGALNSLSNDQEITESVNQTTPTLTGATNNAIIETMNIALRIIQARQQSNSGFSSEEDFQTNRNLWIKTFGSWGKQGNKGGVIGYNSNAYGLITGADKEITDQARLGVGASYFNSKLTSNNDNNQVNVDSFLGIIYGSYSLDDRTEVNAQIAAGYNSSHSNRNINFGGLNRAAKGSYDGWSSHIGTGISRLVNVSSDTIIAPQFRLDYFAIGNQSYNESGAGALDLHVASQMQAQLTPALEVKADHKFTPELSLALNGGLGYDLLHDANNVSASFAAGGGEFITHGLKPSPWVIRSGAGLTWKKSDKFDFIIRYDRRDRSNYDNQTVSLKLRMLF